MTAFDPNDPFEDMFDDPLDNNNGSPISTKWKVMIPISKIWDFFCKKKKEKTCKETENER